MKRILIAIAGIAMILTGTNAFAQGKYGADSAECIKYLSYYQDYYKQRNYDDAMRRLGQYPGATDIALSDLPLSWGNTMGMPVRLPKEWKNRAS